jgi:hypothetical protein
MQPNTLTRTLRGPPLSRIELVFQTMGGGVEEKIKTTAKKIP